MLSHTFSIEWPASVLSSLAWILAGFIILAHAPSDPRPLILGILVSGSVCAVGITATIWHYTTEPQAKVLDCGAVMFCMWTLLGTAAASTSILLSLICVALGTIAALFIRSIPQEPIVFGLAVLSAAQLHGFWVYVAAFIVFGIARAVSDVHKNRVIADWMHAVWHVGTAVLIVIVSLNNLHAI